jgi:hypothetical protein
MLLVALLLAQAPPLDLRQASVSGPSPKAVQMLVEEVQARTRIRWPINAPGNPAIVLSKTPGLPPEGFRISVQPSQISIQASDDRGLLFGVGKLLRSLDMTRDHVQLPADFQSFTSAPKYKLRGHQLGYRPKTNSYDGWTVAMWEQYYRDLIVFGANAVELIPPRSDDDADSPHFPLPPMPMMVEMSRLAKDYSLDLWIWYPALDKDYSDPATVESALKEWGDVFRQLSKVDAVFVPGGDPGHTQPRYLMALLEKQSANLRRYHPDAQMWVAPQGFTAEWMDEFLALVDKQPAWLGGIVFGPQLRISLPELRQRIPQRYPIRFYPDITHSLRSEFPVPDWDLAYALTLQREPINPRPVDESLIFRRLQPYADAGFITYSEGCNDDVNKAVWSALGWDPDADLAAVLRDYARYFIGPDVAGSFAQGLFALEQNWRGPLAANSSVDTTLAQFRDMERAAPPSRKLNWRFQQALYRAYYDAYIRARLLDETAREQQVLDRLRRTRSIDGLEAALAPANVAPDLRARVFELAEALFQSVRMQLSVPRYQAIDVGRGANLDLIDAPLNNRLWLAQRFAAIRAAPSEPDRQRLIDETLNWTDPGPGGFYDDLGNASAQPHLVRGASFADDPDAFHAARTGFASRAGSASWRKSWQTHSETFYEFPLEMRYTGLDPQARYKVRVFYGGENTPAEIRLVANGQFEVHPFRKKDAATAPVEFPLPPQATASGTLSLKWTKTPGLGGAGRGIQISEVWLIREQTK